MSTLYLDLETFNAVPIAVGPYRYAETAEVLLLAYAFDDGPVGVWDKARLEACPRDLRQALRDPRVIVTAHNASFDRTILRLSLGLEVPIGRWRCTMAKALSHAFPGSLDACCKILGVPRDKAKSAEGKKLINRFCKPAPRNHKADRYDHATHPHLWERFKQYAAQDIEAMREVDKRVPDWNWRADDIALYHLDQRINDRGFMVDRELAQAGAKAAETEQARMAAEFARMTGGAVEKPTQREKFRQWLNARFDLALDDTRAGTLRDALNRSDLDPICRRAMEIAVAANKTSTAKYSKLHAAICADGRFRGGLQFRGASRTRRWSGRVFQPQNLPSRGLPEARSIDSYIRALKADTHEFLFEDRMRYGSAALRGVVVAPQGCKLAVADLANIESRALAWLAGEDWKIKAFAAYDAGRGPDLYTITAASILGGRPQDIGKTKRDIFGKVPDLAFGYGGGFGACRTFADAHGVAFADHWSAISENVDPALIAAAHDHYDAWGEQRNPRADRREWIACEAVKLAWRARHPKIVALWQACERAATAAFETRGACCRAGPRFRFKMMRHAGHAYLLCRLPSKRFLVYFSPGRALSDNSLSYMGADATATGGAVGQWRRVSTYGGKLVENACQSLSLDILAANMTAIEASGFDIVLTVHDEIVAETRNGKSADNLAAMMATRPEWLPGFPLKASGFECERYRKE